MKTLLSFFKPRETVVEDAQLRSDELVKQIHNEVDSLENKFEEEYKQLLKELKIPTENEITNKANKLKALGFSVKNETVAQGERIQSNIEEVEKIKRETRDKLQLQGKYRVKYPNDKIISLDDFNKVINKYDLVYGTADLYIKDIPEKNVNEIAEAKETDYLHKPKSTYFITRVEIDNFRKNTKVAKRLLKAFNKEGLIVKTNSPFQSEQIEAIEKALGYTFRAIDIRMAVNNIYFEEVNNSNLFIAAPKSHFDTSNVIFDGKQMIVKPKAVKSTIAEPKDPIAFYMLKDGFVRIVSKWGTSDDQSYLDPIVQNERDN